MYSKLELLMDCLKPVSVIIVVILIGVALSFTVGTRNMDDLKANAPKFLESHKFEVVAYQGYEQSVTFGAITWYTLERDDIIYEAAVLKWRGEYHLYNLKAINAVSTND